MFLCSSCAAVNQPFSPYGHEKYRGDENSPHTNLRRLNVDPNVVMNMGNNDFDEYMGRLDKMQRYHELTIRNNAAAANAERAWISRQDTNGIGYQVNRAVGRGMSDIIRDASDGFGEKIYRSIVGRR